MRGSASRSFPIPASAAPAGGLPVDKRILGLLVALFVLFADQYTKYQVRKHIPLNMSVEVIDGYVKFTHIRNPNSVFGISLGKKFPYRTFSVLTIALFLFLLLKETDLYFIIIYGLLTGAAAGNVMDRFRFGEVVDFIDIGISRKLRWAIFNVADASITIGLIVFLILLFLRERRSKQEVKDNDFSRNDLGSDS
ncbi:MAG: signal peptidase II [Candidatus Hydrothermota bacterium]|uniref:Lipoprotein signal peptidase n=1 Tax=candidate division WOR-3 bacterium TaxID=2052148 RepID=A0A7C0XBH4_UNCW3|nr:MAG: signal peptidase II [Candidatus Hydrothermae bacterium]HDM90795.1 signal peptidase II [candidate division WOR-3 bacterium]